MRGSFSSMMTFFRLVLRVYEVYCFILIGLLSIVFLICAWFLKSGEQCLEKVSSTNLSPAYSQWACSGEGRLFIIGILIVAILSYVPAVKIYRRTLRVVDLTRSGQFHTPKSVSYLQQISIYFLALYLITALGSLFGYFMSPGPEIVGARTIDFIDRVSVSDFIFARFDGATCIFLALIFQLFKELAKKTPST